MFDTMTMTKVIGGLCGTLLVFLLGGWMAEIIYASDESQDGEQTQAYIIEVPENDGAPAEDVVQVAYADIAGDASAADGEGEWRNCRSCHALAEGENGVGPHLNGVVGRNIGAVDAYAYSGSLQAVAEVWTEENLFAFLENPSGWAPGTKMSYNGLKDPMDRANLIAYLASNPGG